MQRFCYVLRNLLQQESRSTTGAPLNPTTVIDVTFSRFVELIVSYLRLRILSVIRIVEEDFVIRLSRSSPYILFENKRPLTSASDWLW